MDVLCLLPTEIMDGMGALGKWIAVEKGEYYTAIGRDGVD